MCGCSDEQETVTLWLWMSPAHTLTLRRSCCSACRPQWSHQFYLCCPVGGEGTKRAKLWCANFILRHCVFFLFFFFNKKTAETSESYDCTADFWFERQTDWGEGRDEAGTQKDVDKQFEPQLKSSLWCFFHTGCSELPDAFQRHSSLKFRMWPLQMPVRRLHRCTEHKLKLV